MLTAKVTHTNGHVVHVRLVNSDSTDTTVATEDTTATLMASSAAGETTTETTVAAAPNPIAAENKELAWAAGSFIVMFIVIRYFLFPKLKKSMDARYAGIRADVEGAEKVKSDARADVAAYEAAVAAARTEANARVDAARQTLDAERTAKLSEVNARISAKRAEADAAAAAAREAAKGQVAAAVTQVATKAAELATGRTPDSSAVQQAVASAMEGAR